MKEIFKLGLILAVFCLISATLLGVTNEVTKDKIAEQRRIENELAKKAVLPEAGTFDVFDEADLAALQSSYPQVAEFSIGKDAAGTAIGYVVKTLPNGYGGAVEVIVGIDMTQTITGVRVGNHQETPGLGAKSKDEPFYGQYTGLSAAGALDYSAIDAISGATITSNAVTDGVNIAIEALLSVGGAQ